VYSEPGHGTSFKVYLPRVDEPAELTAAPTATAEPAGGTETVLVVEDAASVRMVTRQVLERYGYAVLEAPNGDTALRLAAGHHGPIHLLLTDVVMPGLSGRQLAEQLGAAATRHEGAVCVGLCGPRHRPSRYPGARHRLPPKAFHSRRTRAKSAAGTGFVAGRVEAAWHESS